MLRQRKSFEALCKLKGISKTPVKSKKRTWCAECQKSRRRQANAPQDGLTKQAACRVRFFSQGNFRGFLNKILNQTVKTKLPPTILPLDPKPQGFGNACNKLRIGGLSFSCENIPSKIPAQYFSVALIPCYCHSLPYA